MPGSARSAHRQIGLPGRTSQHNSRWHRRLPWIQRRWGEGGGIDRKCVILHASRQEYWDPRHQVGSLRGLIVSVRQLVGERFIM